MSGTIVGGKKAAKKNIERQGADFYRRIGAVGGRNGNTGGFKGGSELASTAGTLGGRRSKHGYKFVKETEKTLEYTDKVTGEYVVFDKKGNILTIDNHVYSA